MSTKNFKEALQQLIELNYNAVEAYETAINKLENKEYKLKLEEFKKVHDTRIEEFSNVLKNRNETFPTGPSAKQWLAKGKVVLANIMGDKAILEAILSNVKDSHTAYEEMVKIEDAWKEAKEGIAQGLADEINHKTWLQKTINEL